MDLSIILPAYNEAERIALTVARTFDFLAQRPWSAEILVVDDGSTDGTLESVTRFGRSVPMPHPDLRCLRHAPNRGKGYSVRRGVCAARGLVIGFMDADYKTDVTAVDAVMGLLDSGADAVIGDRTLRGTRIEVPRRTYRELGSRLFRYLVQRLVGLQGFPDTQCGFKFFRAAVARELFELQRTDGFMFDVEILLLAARRGYRVQSIPVRWSDDPDSRFRPVSGSLRNLAELLRMRRRVAGVVRS